MIVALALALGADVPLVYSQPGFDCAKAATPIERTICANPNAAVADGRMAAQYGHAWHALSLEGRQALLANQRHFLRWLSITCDPRNRYFERRLTRDTCLIEKLDDRTRELKDSVTIAAGHVFLTLTSLMETPVPPDPDEHNLPPLRNVSMTLVQIDRPHSAAERRWNMAMRTWLQDGLRLLEGDDGPNDEQASQVDVGIKITAASSAIISASLGASGYYGGPHPVSYSRAMIWALPLGRALNDRDVLRNVHDPAVDRLLSSFYNANYSGGPEGCDRPKAVGRVPTLTPKAVTYTYDPYELGGYPCGGGSEIPRSRIERSLKPLVRAAHLEVPKPLS
ncbi:lysozyme inhibitor LprI family protein [uncultured Sphingomonas sp.]|uniref:lysozyme inhibitor LprI family protein n=1 Tax=uncultured Sphingomonas sp. TaxID=158754 RepID=UPI0025E723FE|nr:lysozyme inhibitor LprI family protein [uncultured Sphingomonas sp.]